MSTSDRYVWKPYTAKGALRLHFGSFGSFEDTRSPLLTTVAEDGSEIVFYADREDWGISPNFIVGTPDGKVLCTDDTQDWTEIERYVPRIEWPEPMYVGKRGPKERRPDREVSRALARHLCEGEGAKLILQWDRTTWPGETVREDGTVILEDWSVPVDRWTVYVSAIVPEGVDVDDYDSHDDVPDWLNGSCGFIVDPQDDDPIDPTDPDPFREAEDRLLAKLGLTRSTVGLVHVEGE